MVLLERYGLFKKSDPFCVPGLQLVHQQLSAASRARGRKSVLQCILVLLLVLSAKLLDKLLICVLGYNFKNGFLVYGDGKHKRIDLIDVPANLLL